MKKNVPDSDKKVSTSLIIGKQQKKILSKQQDTFNKLVQRIEKMRSELLLFNKSLDDKLDFYAKNIYPLETQLTELQKTTLKLLYPFYKNKKILSKKQHTSLGGVMSDLLEIIIDTENGELADDLKEIFKAVQGVSYEEAKEEDFELAKSEMESLFGNFGYDVNLDGLEKDMDREEFMKKALEMEEQIKSQIDEKYQKQKERKKTKRQLEQEEKAKQAEELRTKNISSIYKQLAKMLHPDLEQDEVIKLQKEELMKELTNAYENKDLHTMLRLELTWIQKEENNPDKLTDEKLSIYNQVLREQLSEMEREMNEMFFHPRYEALHNFVVLPREIKGLNLLQEKKGMDNYKKVLTAGITKLSGNDQQALAEVKRFIREFDSDNEDLDDFLYFK